MLNKRFVVKFQNNQDEDLETITETLEEAFNLRVELIDEGFKNIEIESERI